MKDLVASSYEVADCNQQNAPLPPPLLRWLPKNADKLERLAALILSSNMVV